MVTKKQKVNPTDQFLADNVADIAAAVDTVTPGGGAKTKGRRLTVRINEDLYEKLWAARGVGEKSMVAVVTAALEKYLDGGK